MKIVLIVGLPGSGKTYLANFLADMCEYMSVVDDITSLDQLPESGDIAITDVNFCDSKILEKAIDMLHEKYSNAMVVVMYFENNPDAARRNVAYRNDGRNVEGTIRRFEKIYNPPDETRKIWNPKD